MSLLLTFRCGHHATIEQSGGAAPVCEVCGERQVARVQAPRPVFRGVGSGPCCEFVALPAVAVTLTEKASK